MDGGLLAYERKRNVTKKSRKYGFVNIQRWGSRKSDGSYHRASGVEHDHIPWKEKRLGVELTLVQSQHHHLQAPLTCASVTFSVRKAIISLF